MGIELKVVHCHNIAGVASTLVQYQRRLGIESSLIVRRRHPYGCSETLTGRANGLLTLAHADIIHYHYSSWIGKLPIIGTPNPDAYFFSAIGKPLVMHFHGDDLRLKLVTLNFRPDHIFVSTPDLLEYAPSGEWLPNPVDHEMFTPNETAKHLISRIGYYNPTGSNLYAPTDDEMNRAISKLKESGFQVEATPVANIPHEHMPEYYRSLTVWVDKIRGDIGAYSIMACEAACSGVPVIASTTKVKRYVRGEVFYEFTGNLVEDLRYLLESEGERRMVASRGREFVQKFHDPLKVARRTVEVYESLT